MSQLWAAGRWRPASLPSNHRTHLACDPGRDDLSSHLWGRPGSASSPTAHARLCLGQTHMLMQFFCHVKWRRSRAETEQNDCPAAGSSSGRILRLTMKDWNESRKLPQPCMHCFLLVKHFTTTVWCPTIEEPRSCSGQIPSDSSWMEQSSRCSLFNDILMHNRAAGRCCTIWRLQVQVVSASEINLDPIETPEAGSEAEQT